MNGLGRARLASTLNKTLNKTLLKPNEIDVDLIIK